MKNKRQGCKLDIVIVVFLCMIFGSTAIVLPVKEYGDSYQYLHHMISRDPVYSLLLQGLQNAFADYTISLGIIQNILAIICIYWTYVRLSEIFEFGILGRLFTVALLLLPHMITPVASRTRMILTCAVLTEGITLSLYYVWLGIMISVIAGRYRNSRMGVYAGLLLSVLLSLIRGQFSICLIMWILTVVYRTIADREYKKIVLYIISLLIAIAGKNCITGIYHYLENGVYTGTAASAPMLLTNMIYVTDEDDISVLNDGWIKDAVRDMYDLADGQKLTQKHAVGNILDRAGFHEDVHETLNFDVVTEVIDELLYRYEGIDETEYNYFVYYRDIYANRIIKELLPVVIYDYAKNVLVTSTLGFIRSVAVDRSVLYIYTILIYAVSMAMTVILLKRDKGDLAGTSMVFVWILIAGTVFGVSLMIECISRYMMYNLPIFYIIILAEFKRYGRIGNLRNI